MGKRAGGWRRDSVPKLHLNCFSFSAAAKALSNLPSAISRSPITFSLYACVCPHNKHHTPPPISSQYSLSMCCIAGNFQGRKLLRIGEKYDFYGGNFRGLHTKGCHAPNFAKKTFAYSHKTMKFVKVFSLESFLLYGIQECNIRTNQVGELVPSPANCFTGA